MIRTAKSGHIGHITLDDPKTRNALSARGMAQFHEVLAEWKNSDIRVLVLTGTGGIFCSGASLAELTSTDWSVNPLTSLCDTVEAFPAPTICALNGSVYGGGAELALACDFRIGVTGMSLLVPPARLGIHYEPAGTARALRTLGQQTTRRLFLTAEKFETGALLDCGFLDEVTTPDTLAGAAGALAERITALAPLAVLGMKQTIYEFGSGTLDATAAKLRIAACFASEDHIEGLAAQKEKRPAVFKGH